jgi:hypothetical protein
MSMQDKRRFKSEWILKKLSQQAQDGIGIRRDILLAEFCRFFGSSTQLAPKFLKELELLDLVIVKDKMIYAKGFFDNYGLQSTGQEE